MELIEPTYTKTTAAAASFPGMQPRLILFPNISPCYQNNSNFSSQ